MRKRESLRQIGDVSLFISGFFSDSLHRKLVDVDYYVSIGGCAYNALSRVETDTFSSVFAELGEKFVGFVDVLSEVSERTSCSSNADLLRLYEKWLKRAAAVAAAPGRARGRPETRPSRRPGSTSHCRIRQRTAQSCRDSVTRGLCFLLHHSVTFLGQKSVCSTRTVRVEPASKGLLDLNKRLT
jgi:hypothetical protein